MTEFDNDAALALLARVKAGDEKAFATLYTSLSRRIFAFALNQVHDDARAEEIVVDTMHEVWKKPGEFNGTSKFSTWVLGIARYKVLNSFREGKHAHDELNDEIAESVESEGRTPFEALAAQQREQGVKRCMSKLTDEHRECMHLAFFEGLTLAEIAELQSCPENTVKTRLFHARQKIKNCLRLLLESEGTQIPEHAK
jgi:RNA polymerase sigma-70 factor, ECF subfamily